MGQQEDGAAPSTYRFLVPTHDSRIVEALPVLSGRVPNRVPLEKRPRRDVEGFRVWRVAAGHRLGISRKERFESGVIRKFPASQRRSVSRRSVSLRSVVLNDLANLTGESALTRPSKARKNRPSFRAGKGSPRPHETAVSVVIPRQQRNKAAAIVRTLGEKKGKTGRLTTRTATLQAVRQQMVEPG